MRRSSLIATLSLLSAPALGSAPLGGEAAPEPPLVASLEKPRIDVIQVLRTGGRSRLSIEYSEVPGAVAYNLQVAKTLTFARLVLDVRTTHSPARELKIPPGVYFVRLRAVFKDGGTTSSKAELVNAMVSGKRLLTRSASSAAAGGGPGEGPAEDLGPLRTRFEALRVALDEIEEQRQALEQMMNALADKLRDSKDEQVTAELNGQLRAIEEARQALYAEVDAALRDLDALLGAPPAEAP